MPTATEKARIVEAARQALDVSKQVLDVAVREYTIAALDADAAQAALDDALAKEQQADARRLEAIVAVQAREAELAAAEALPVFEPLVLHEQILSLYRVVHPEAAGRGRYSRHQEEVEFFSDSFSILVRRVEYPGGGLRNFVVGATYTMHVSNDLGAVKRGDLGVAAVSWTPTAGQSTYAFKGAFPLTFADAPVFFTLTSTATGESFPTWAAILDRRGEFKEQPYIIVQTNNFDWTHDSRDEATNTAVHQVAIVHRDLFADGPVVRPFVYTKPEPFSTIKTAADLVVEHIVAPFTGREQNRLYFTKKAGISPITGKQQGGNPTTAGRQAYAFTDIVTGDYGPLDQPLLTGRRGRASFTMGTYLHNGFEGKHVGMSPWACVRFDATGFAKTLFGLEQPLPVYWEHATIDGATIIGKWPEGYPKKYQYPLESWGALPVPRSLQPLDTSRNVNGRHPHMQPVRWLWVDRHEDGRLCEAVFPGDVEPTAEPNCRKLANAKDAWGLAYIRDDVLTPNGVALVGAREENAIVMFDALTGARLGNFYDGPSLGRVHEDRLWRPFGDPDNPETLRQIRSFPCTAVESVRVWRDKITGKRYVYWGSLALKQVRRAEYLPGGKAGPWEVVVDADKAVGNNANYLFFDISDSDPSDGEGGLSDAGCFMPDGTVGYQTWDLGNNGWPLLFAPQAGKATDGTVQSIKLANAAGTLFTVGWLALSRDGTQSKEFRYRYTTDANGKYVSTQSNATEQANIKDAALREFGTPLTNAKRIVYEPDMDLSYGSAFSMKGGRMTVASALNGLVLVRARLPSDPPRVIRTSVEAAAISRGARKYEKHKRMIYGPGGHSWINLALPFGEDADLDAYMATFERAQPPRRMLAADVEPDAHANRPH